MRRKKAGRIVRIITGTLLGILGVFALALLALAVYAGMTRTAVGVGLGTVDVTIGPSDYGPDVREMYFGQPYITRSANPSSTPVCYLGNTHQTAFGSVSLYVETCDIWSGQPRPGAVPTIPAKVYPLPVPTVGTTVTTP